MHVLLKPMLILPVISCCCLLWHIAYDSYVGLSTPYSGAYGLDGRTAADQLRVATAAPPSPAQHTGEGQTMSAAGAEGSVG